MMANNKKTIGQKIDRKIEKISKIDDVVVAEINEPVGTITFKKWHVGIAAIVITTALIVAIIL
jgi:hypothetical protein